MLRRDNIYHKNLKKLTIITAFILVFNLLFLPNVISSTFQAIYGYIDYSDGTPIPNGIPVLVTNLNSSKTMIRYTITAENGHTGFYYLDAYDLDSEIGDTILVNISYGGCQGNNSVDVNNWASRICNVTIYGNLPPFIPDKPSGPTSGYNYAYLVFSTKTTDPDEPADQIRYGWDWDGDDTVDEWTDLYSSNETFNITHHWQQTGTYTVKVKAQDSHGAERGLAWSDALYITIIRSPKPPNQKPVAAFTYTPINPFVNDVIIFNDTSTDDGTIVNWSWNFDDGTNSTDQNPTHIYTEPGTYTVTLTVKDNKNSVDDTQQTITVSKQPLPPDTDWQETAYVNLTHNSNNRGLNYMVWKGAAIMASRLADKALLSADDYISIFSKTDGEWLTYTIGLPNQVDFQISPWDIIIIKTTSEKTIIVDISQQDISTQSITINFTTESTTKKSNMGYNFFAWTSNTVMSIKDFVETYGLSNDNIAISLYNPDTGSWDTYNPSLPAVLQKQFTIRLYSLICTKVAKDSQERVLVIT